MTIKYFGFLFFFFLLVLNNGVNAQINQKKLDKIFRSTEILPVKLKFSPKQVRKSTKDSIRTKAVLSYQDTTGISDSLNITLDARGNFRLKRCYFPPTWIRIKKSQAKGTVFKGQKKMKLVMPCLKQKQSSDYVIKEYLAYKIYELVSPYHFKTRLVNLTYTELKGDKEIPHEMKAFLIEDDKEIAKRHKGTLIKSVVYPAMYDEISAVRISIFQYLIANVDFSNAYQHNAKMMYLEGRSIPISYDFDMSGFVDASYSFVPDVGGEDLGIKEVTQRMYRGFKRDKDVFYRVRGEYIANKDLIFKLLEDHQQFFKVEKEYKDMVRFVESFYKVIESENRFKNEIIHSSRDL